MTSSSERAPDPRPARTRAAIFAAARELSAADGEVTVNALAKRAGVSRAAFYSHFTGLDDLMGAMLQQMFDAAWERGRTHGVGGDFPIQDHVRYGFAMMVAYVERHHAFLRGSMDWKATRRTYVTLTETIAALHVEALRRMPEHLPARPGKESLARGISGNEIAHAEHWLLSTEQAAKDGEELDATELLETILAAAPSWYTGIGPEEPIDAAGLLASARTYGQDDDAKASETETS
jgi:AcrR family transcriptional regulator